MTATPQPDQIRKVVLQVFAELGVKATELLEMNETLFVQNRRYLARSYRAGGVMAMWLIDLGVLQFYAGDGQMLRTINLFHEMESQRAAA